MSPEYLEREPGAQSAPRSRKQLNSGHEVLAHYPRCRPATLASDTDVPPYQGCMICRDWQNTVAKVLVGDCW